MLGETPGTLESGCGQQGSVQDRDRIIARKNENLSADYLENPSLTRDLLSRFLGIRVHFLWLLC